jgi:hypothetical protein
MNALPKELIERHCVKKQQRQNPEMKYHAKRCVVEATFDVVRGVQ